MSSSPVRVILGQISELLDLGWDPDAELNEADLEACFSLTEKPGISALPPELMDYFAVVGSTPAQSANSQSLFGGWPPLTAPQALEKYEFHIEVDENVLDEIPAEAEAEDLNGKVICRYHPRSHLMFTELENYSLDVDCGTSEYRATVWLDTESGSQLSFSSLLECLEQLYAALTSGQAFMNQTCTRSSSGLEWDF